MPKNVFSYLYFELEIKVCQKMCTTTAAVFHNLRYQETIIGERYH